MFVLQWRKYILRRRTVIYGKYTDGIVEFEIEISKESKHLSKGLRRGNAWHHEPEWVVVVVVVVVVVLVVVVVVAVVVVVVVAAAAAAVVVVVVVVIVAVVIAVVVVINSNSSINSR